jgi:hypothetical protein
MDSGQMQLCKPRRCITEYVCRQVNIWSITSIYSEKRKYRAQGYYMIKGAKQIQKCKNNYEELGKYERKCFKVLYLNSRSGRIIPISILLEEICPSYLQAQISVSDDVPKVTSPKGNNNIEIRYPSFRVKIAVCMASSSSISSVYLQ